MNKIHKEILIEFVNEAKQIVVDCLLLLEMAEESENKKIQAQKLSEYANKIDRIMGAAKSLSLEADEDHPLQLVGHSAALCKAVGYQASEEMTAAPVREIMISFLLDVTELISDIIHRFEKTDDPADFTDLQLASGTYVERLRMIPEATAARKKAEAEMSQNEIDSLIKKLTKK